MLEGIQMAKTFSYWMAKSFRICKGICFDIFRFTIREEIASVHFKLTNLLISSLKCQMRQVYWVFYLSTLLCWVDSFYAQKGQEMVSRLLHSCANWGCYQLIIHAENWSIRFTLTHHHHPFGICTLDYLIKVHDYHYFSFYENSQ